MSAKFFRKMAILAVIEATVGTLALVTSANAIEVSDVTVTPIEGDEVDQGVIRPYFGASPTTMVTEYRKVAFSVGFAGVGVAGMLPGYTPLLRGCSAKATNVPAPDPDPHTLFEPVTDGSESLSIYITIDRRVYKMAGSRGNCKIACDAKGIPKLQFEFTGSFVPVEDVGSMPAVDYSKFMRPLGVNKLNTTLSIDSFNAAANSFQFDFGNQVVKQDLMNVDATEITGRSSTGSVTFRDTAVATKNWVEMARTSAVVPIELVHGQGATNTVRLTIPRAQIGKPTFGEQDGIHMITIPFRCLPSNAGNDEWALRA